MTLPTESICIEMLDKNKTVNDSLLLPSKPIILHPGIT